jgi:hypothetical protein
MAHYRKPLLTLLSGRHAAVAPSAEEARMGVPAADEEAPTLTAEQQQQAAAAASALTPGAAGELRSLRCANAAADWWAVTALVRCQKGWLGVKGLGGCRCARPCQRSRRTSMAGDV